MKKLFVIPWTLFKKNWIFILFIALFMIFLELVFHELCMFKALLGFPCPACGMTRAYKALFRLDIGKAFYYHPLFPLVPIVFGVCIYKDLKIINTIYRSKIFWIVMFSIIIITFVIRLIVLYPKAPMDLNGDSLLFRFLRLIN